MSISSKTGEGIAELSSLVKKLLSSSSESDRSQTGLGSERQKVAVEDALESVSHALALSSDFALDAVVQDLEDSMRSESSPEMSRRMIFSVQFSAASVLVNNEISFIITGKN